MIRDSLTLGWGYGKKGDSGEREGFPMRISRCLWTTGATLREEFSGHGIMDSFEWEF